MTWWWKRKRRKDPVMREVVSVDVLLCVTTNPDGENVSLRVMHDDPMRLARQMAICVRSFEECLARMAVEHDIDAEVLGREFRRALDTAKIHP